MERYEYRELEKGDIRLFLLHQGRPDQPLRGRIIHTTLKNPTFIPARKDTRASLEYDTSYEAISYHWGSDAATPYHVTVDDEQAVLPVTAALYGVLKQLILPDRDRLLWADAICIDQVDSNSREKEDQIRLMPDIYRIAQRVLVYLGPEADNSDLGIALLEKLADYSEYLDENLNTAGHGGYELALERGMVLPPPTDPSWEALRALWRRPWFRRVWVIQEFVYAAEIVVLCGSREIDWKKLYLAAKVYSDSRRIIFAGFGAGVAGAGRLEAFRLANEGAIALHTIANLRVRARGYMSPAYIILSLTDDKARPAAELERRGMRGDRIPIRRDLDAINESSIDSRPDILDLAHSTANFLATKPVDRLYALRALFEGGDDEDFTAIYPEESSDEETLKAALKRFTAALLKRGRGPEVLSSAGLRPASSRVPASVPFWVPDWISETDLRDRRIGFCKLTNSFRNKARAKGEEVDEEFAIYHAALDTPFEYRIDDDDADVLVLKGVPVDIVHTLLPGRLLMNPTIYENVVREMVPTYPTGESHEEVVWRTMIANRTHEGQRPPPEFFAEYRALRHRTNSQLGFALLGIAVLLLVSVPIIVPIIRLLSMKWYVLIVGGLVGMRQLSLYFGIGSLAIILSVQILHTVVILTAVGLAGWFALRSGHDLLLSFYGFLASRAMLGWTPADSGPPESARYLRSFAFTANHYHMCVTARGYVGLVPLSTQRGDEVVILHGCDAPFVVRRRGKLCFLVGDAYIHGIMNGEALEGLGSEVGEIRLR